jgi:peptidoglycan glycosyltransferase
VLDAAGELVAIVDGAGRLSAEAGATPLLAAALSRLAPIPSAPTVRLALDAELSRLALDALGTARGSIVLVDALSGAVRAAVSDPRTAATEPEAAFSQRREPASIAKLITAAAAYRAGRDPDASIARMTCTGVERYAGQPLWCPTPAGPLGGLDRALAWSCNVAFANVAVELGSAPLEDEYRRWGFDRPASELLGAAGRIHTPPRTARQLADLAVGLENVDVTPLHAALLATVVANEGRLALPWLVDAECGGLGLVGRPAPAARGTSPPAASAEMVLDPAVARRLARAMRAVTSYGTGAGLAPPGVVVSMKTGTAAEFRKGYHVNYVGWLEHGSLAFCVRVTHERSSPAVTRRAREVAARLFAALAPRLLRNPGPLRQASASRLSASSTLRPGPG